LALGEPDTDNTSMKSKIFTFHGFHLSSISIAMLRRSSEPDSLILSEPNTAGRLTRDKFISVSDYLS
jgi:hypothetical protein